MGVGELICDQGHNPASTPRGPEVVLAPSHWEASQACVLGLTPFRDTRSTGKRAPGERQEGCCLPKRNAVEIHHGLLTEPPDKEKGEHRSLTVLGLPSHSVPGPAVNSHGSRDHGRAAVKPSSWGDSKATPAVSNWRGETAEGGLAELAMELTAFGGACTFRSMTRA